MIIYGIQSLKEPRESNGTWFNDADETGWRRRKGCNTCACDLLLLGKFSDFLNGYVID